MICQVFERLFYNFGVFLTQKSAKNTVFPLIYAPFNGLGSIDQPSSAKAQPARPNPSLTRLKAFNELISQWLCHQTNKGPLSRFKDHVNWHPRQDL